MSTSTSLVELCTKLNAQLVSLWGEEFAERLLSDQEAALGFAMARSIEKGWATPVDEIDSLVCAAEHFLIALEDAEG